MKYNFLRIACASPELKVADCVYNAQQIVDSVKEAELKKAEILVFPELCISSYSCNDLFLQNTVIESSIKSLLKICAETLKTKILFVVGLPVKFGSKLYNVAAFCQSGKILAFVPKSFIPNYSEFYEARWFSPAFKGVKNFVLETESENLTIPFGTDILISSKDGSVKVAAEICEDLWVPLSPSTRHALCGANVILNLSASNEIVGKADYRKNLVVSHSAKTLSVYAYANASQDESTTDLIFSGHSIIASNGTLCVQSELFENRGSIIYSDVDMEKINFDRMKTTTFTESADENYVEIIAPSDIGCSTNDDIDVSVLNPYPFVPQDDLKRKERCRAIINMQANGLAKRLRHTNCREVVLGISGGLDSTLALMVCNRAFEICGLDKKGINAITMPCFGTSVRTRTNATNLAEALGITFKEIVIKDSVNQHFADIGHDPEIHNIAYENCQARERTQVLMDYSNDGHGFVIGTGDLSELALGWCTYNGDHMSMYGVNTSIPKTLVKYLVQYFADETENKIVRDTLMDIIDTPVSPELLPPDKDGKIAQKTEDNVGPYVLHDFFLYNTERFGFSPKKVYFLACKAFKETYDKDFIKKWLIAFYKRFFSQQFKRSCMPDGAKVGTINLSPRGDWRMPSDASAAMWLMELEK